MHLHRTTITISEVMLKMNRIIKDMKVTDMSVDLTTVREDMEVEVYYLGIMKNNHVDPSRVSHAIKKVTDKQTSHTRTEPI